MKFVNNSKGFKYTIIFIIIIKTFLTIFSDVFTILNLCDSNAILVYL